MTRQRRIATITTNGGPGGSEYLWIQTASALANMGHQVLSLLHWNVAETKDTRAAEKCGVRIQHLDSFASTGFINWPVTRLKRVAGRAALLRFKPDLVLISVGFDYAEAGWTRWLRSHSIPYAIVTQGAAPYQWPSDDLLPLARASYAGAKGVFTVTANGGKQRERQLGLSLPHMQMVYNPFLVPRDMQVPWPDSPPFRLACVARLYPPTKGQDLLFEVLAQKQWRERPVKLSLFGSGPHRESLLALANNLSLTSVEFRGHVSDVTEIWREHHALVLPSRQEGLPLAEVEAMHCARPCIVTDVDGCAEVLHDNVTGFVAEHPTVPSLAVAMERAWQQRTNWKEMGAAAATEIRRLVPADPATELAKLLLQLL